MCLSPQLAANVFRLRTLLSWGACVAQSVKRPASAQVKISRFVSLSPAWGSVLTAQSLEPASDCVSVSLSPSTIHSKSLYLFQK